MFCFALIRYKREHTNRIGETWNIIKRISQEIEKQAYIYHFCEKIQKAKT